VTRAQKSRTGENETRQLVALICIRAISRGMEAHVKRGVITATLAAVVVAISERFSHPTGSETSGDFKR
jgi:hypothetical protein